MTALILVAGVLFIACLAAQFASIISAIWRIRKSEMAATSDAGVSILRPVCGMENFIEETLRSTFALRHSRFEVLFCVADSADPVIPLLESLIAEHPHIDAKILVGHSTASANPKLNNLVKGWHGSRYDWVLMVDSNVLMPPDQLQRMQAVWDEQTGLVCSPPVGWSPHNVWAELECAFLNTYQARWQCFADFIGLGFAQGKAMLWRRDILEAAGGIKALADELAEDAAATKIVRAQNLRVRLVTAPFPQPLGGALPPRYGAVNFVGRGCGVRRSSGSSSPRSSRAGRSRLRRPHSRQVWLVGRFWQRSPSSSSFGTPPRRSWLG